MTLAACPEGSRSDDFIKNLGFAAVYFFQDGDLFIDMFADGGTLQLAPASPTTQASPAVPDAAALVEKLGNLSFTGLLPEQAVTLVDGEFSYDEGASQPATIRLVDHGLPTGDLDGDGLPDAVVLLRLNTSGTGNFTYAAAVLDAFGNPVPTETTLLGDRISVKSLGIEGGVLTAELIAQGPGDPLCCASWNVRKTFTLQDGRLVELSSKDVSKVSFNDLDGTSWQLVDLNGMAGEPVLPDSPVTLQIGGGQVSGSAGCNMYSAEVSGQPDSPSAMTVGPAATSMMMCEGPNASQEAAYLQRLAGVTSWQYDAGRLVLAYEQEGQTGTLVFEPAE
jgi:heat shock protein HslJ